jgi:Ca-activated chloride channel homolog
MTRTHFLLITAAALSLAALVSGGVNGRPGGPSSGGAQLLPPPPSSTAPAGQRTALLTGLAGPMRLEARLSADRVLAGASTMYLETNVVAAPAERLTQRLPVNLAVALDRSGSMSGNKLAQAKRAALALVDAVRDGDRLAVIAFGSDVTVFPSTLVDASGRAALRGFVESIQDSGSTNISGALAAATEEVRKHREAYRVSRVILLSDGQPTEGLTSPSDLKALVSDARSRHDVTTSAFGVGLDFNSRLMSDLANTGAGNYAFIEDASAMASVFERDLDTASSTVARRVELELRPGPGVEVLEVPGYELTRTASGYRVGLYDFANGQTAQSLFRLQVSGAPAEGELSLGVVTLRFVGARDGDVREVPLKLAATATTRSDEVQAHSDAQLLELARRMDVTKHLAAAVTAYESGDREKAYGIFDGIRRQFGQSADALAGDDLAAVERKLRSGNAEGARAAKSLTDKTMKNFGQNNTYTN